MRLLISLCIFCIIGFSANAASIVYYESKKPGEIELIVRNSNYIKSFIYFEEDKKLRAYSGNVYEDYKVQTVEEALNIIKKVYNDNDSSLIELELD